MNDFRLRYGDFLAVPRHDICHEFPWLLNNMRRTSLVVIAPILIVAGCSSEDIPELPYGRFLWYRKATHAGRI